MSPSAQAPFLLLALAAVHAGPDRSPTPLTTTLAAERGASGISASAPAVGTKARQGNFTINAGLTGPWYEAATNGQGFLLDVVPSASVLSFGWFTYGPARADGSAPPQRWLTGAGAYSGTVAVTTLFLSEGGAFQAGPVPDARAVGSARFEFADCGHATVAYSVRRNALSGEGDPTSGDLIQGEIALARVTADQYCDELTSAAAGQLADPAGIMAAGRWYPRDRLRAAMATPGDAR